MGSGLATTFVQKEGVEGVGHRRSEEVKPRLPKRPHEGWAGGEERSDRNSFGK